MNTRTLVRVRAGNPSVIELHGDIDHAHALEVDRLARGLLTTGTTRLVVDCTDITSPGEGILAALRALSQRASDVGGRVTLLSPCEHLIRLLTVAGLDRQFGILESPTRDSDMRVRGAKWKRFARYTVSAQPDVVSDVRRVVTELARTLPFTEQQIGDIALTVGEAASNAVRHGSPKGEENRITVRCGCTEDRFVVEVSDEGNGFDPEAKMCHLEDDFQEGGRGLFFMHLLMDRVSFVFDGGTTVRLEKLLRRQADMDEKSDE